VRITSKRIIHCIPHVKSGGYTTIKTGYVKMYQKRDSSFQRRTFLMMDGELLQRCKKRLLYPSPVTEFKAVQSASAHIRDGRDLLLAGVGYW
jgi:hypothetical protein